MAAMALKLRSKQRNLRNPFIQLFSSSSNGGEDKKKLEFRRRSSSPPSDEKSSTSSTFSSTQNISFDAIRESLRQFQMNNTNQTPTDRFKAPYNRGNTFRMQHESGSATRSNFFFGGSGTISHPVFAKELGSQSETEFQVPKTEYVKRYTYEELGEKLCKLRPTVTETKENKNWFSLDELNERLKKLSELEAEEDSKIVGFEFKSPRECLRKLRMPTDNNSDQSLHGPSILSHQRGTQNLMLAGPKEELVEKHFCPDNMSSAEKLTMVHQKVSDEFKMSELDCGSSLVQVTQLTTKVKHLISAPYKKFIQLSMLRKFLIISILLSINAFLFTIAYYLFMVYIFSIVLLCLITLFCCFFGIILVAMGINLEPK